MNIISSTENLPDSTTSVTGGGGNGLHTLWVWHLDWSWFQIVQLLIGCVGIIGNLLVILVLLRQKAYKHTVDIMIGALALADLITSIFTIPIPTAVQVPDTFLGGFYCKWISSKNSLYIGINASIYTLVGITIQRFIAVVFPLHLGRLVTKRRVYIYLVAVWVFAVVNVTPSLDVRVENSRCVFSRTDFAHKFVTMYLLFLRVIVPCIIMITTQAFTARALHRQSAAMRSARSELGSQPSFHINARNRVVKLMFIIVFVCLVSMAPHNVVITVFAMRGQFHLYLGTPLHIGLRLFSFINFCANPFIYAARYPRFRGAIKEMFNRKGGARDSPLFDHDQQTGFADVNDQAAGTMEVRVDSISEGVSNKSSAFDQGLRA